INYVVGMDIFTHTVTVTADLIGRSLSSAENFANSQTTYNYFADNGAGGTDVAHLHQATRTAIGVTGTGRLNLLLGVIGAKVQIPGTRLLLTGSVLFPL